ncbi:hypothetical protein FIBSPDRAFT_859636 [Athelia psychrophila]|uniref:Uncharacterized protein n=1 Tax=Athelia psychrophila TaxID=1759441 RepID=A0A166KWS1_9AGAM|nr:hypothetical protein FIBSPDRAFT_859636 [Fibularhizoctonia sp. CBS 109695]
MHQGRLSPDSDEDSNFHFDTLSPAHSFPSHSFPFSDRASAPQLFNPAHANGQHVRPLGKARKDSGSPTRVPFSTSSSSGSSFWRNPFKKSPKRVTFTPARRGFRVDETDLSTSAAESRRPTLTASSLGHGAIARREDRERELERERLAGVREGEGIEGEGVAEDSVLLISRETTIPSPPLSPPPHPQEPQAAPSPTLTASSPQQHVQEPRPAPPAVKLIVIPPSRAGTFKVHHPALASSPTLPLATPVAPPTPHTPSPPRTPPPTHTSARMTAPATTPSPRLLRPLPPPPPPLSSPPSYYSGHPPSHPPLQSILIPNHTTHASPSPVEPASPPYSPSRNLNPLLRAHSRNVSSESVGLIRPARADPINLIPASVRSAGYNPYAGTSQPNLGLSAGVHSRSPSDGSEGGPAGSLHPPPFS